MEYVPGKTITEAWNRCAVKHTGFPTGVAIYLIGELVGGARLRASAGGHEPRPPRHLALPI